MALGPSYELGGLLGRGGMGAVYHATDRRLRRDVAIKVLPPELGYSAEHRARFVREAQLAAGLSHPNIVSIYDVGEQGDLVWFVMARINGENMRVKVEREGPQPISVVRRVLQEVAQALAYAHASGVVHRDVKPDNIMLDGGSGRALVTDFGIAIAQKAGVQVTQPGEVVGTARYMSPEQALADGRIDGRSDMYSLGLVGYFVLTGEHLIKGRTFPAVIGEHVNGVSVSFDQAGRRIPRPLAAALERCLAPKPAQRYERLEEFSEALRELGGELPDTPGPVRKLLRDGERTFSMAVLGSVALGIVGVEEVPPALLWALAAFAFGPFVLAVEQATGSGFGWAAVRRALYVERMRRVDEGRRSQATLGPAGVVTIVGLLGAGAIALRSIGMGEGNPVNLSLEILGFLGWLMAARILGLTRVRRTIARRTSIGSASAIASLAILPVMVAIGVIGGGGVRRLPLALAIGIGGFGLAVLARWLTRRPAPVPEETLSEWRISPSLDVLGSFLLARIARRGWRFVLERDRPASVTPRVNAAEAHVLLKRLRRMGSHLDGTARQLANDAVRLGADLAAECSRVDREIGPLGAKLARLNEGVLVSRTVGLGGSVEGELDLVERQVDLLRVRIVDYVAMLRDLAAGLDVAVASRDTSELEAALVKGRELSRVVAKHPKVRSATA